MLDSRDIGGMQGAPVLGRDDDKLGTVGQVFLDSLTGVPNWVTVKTGLFGTKETFVPLADAAWNGEEIHVDFDKETIKGAPRIETDEALSPHNEEALYRYYGLSDRDTDGGTARPDTYPDRQYDYGPDGQAVTPVPTGADRLRDSDRDGIRDATDRDGWSDADASRRVDDDTAAVAARPDGTFADDSRRSRADDAPRDLADFHPEEARRQGGVNDPHDLRMSEQPLGEPASPATGSSRTGESTGRHSRMRRFDPDGVNPDGRRNDPPRTL